MKKAAIVGFIFVFVATALLHQNCTGELLEKEKKSSMSALDLQFKYSQMYIPVGSQVLALDGTCASNGYPKNRINWQTVINGKAVAGSVDNVCNNTSKTFALNINLAPYSLPANSKFNIVGSMVGIDSRGRMTVGKTQLLAVSMVSGSGTGTVSGTNTGGSPGGNVGANSGLDGEMTGTSTGSHTGSNTGSNTGSTTGEEYFPPDVCTPGASAPLGDISWATTIEPNSVIADWPETSEITDVTMDGAGGICIYHTKLGSWPVVDTFGEGLTTEGNYWFVSSIGDFAWFIWPFHWYRPGQACKNISMSNTGLESGVGGSTTPLTFWTPCPGSLVGIVASTPGRMGAQGPIQERSNIFWIYWP